MNRFTSFATLGTALLLAATAACSDTREKPSTTPPDPWGVPISGGNMTVLKDGTHAVIADPDRDRVMIVDIATGDTNEIALQPNDEPGRVIEDAAGRLHVSLRRGGAIVTIANGAVTARRAVCAEPRGLAYDASSDSIHIACTTGELVTMPAAGGDATRVLHLDRDLRDVIVQSNGTLAVTRFRTAELLTIDATGAITTRVKPPTVQRISVDQMGGPAGGQGSGSSALVDAVAAVAWRTIALPDHRVVMAHQRQLQTTLQTMHGGYGQGCGQGPVEDAVTVVDATGVPVAVAPLVAGALPVDMAADANGSRLAFVTAGTKNVHIVSTSALSTHDDDQCGGMGGGGGDDQVIEDQLGIPTSVAFDPAGDLLAYYPELPALVVHSGTTARTMMLPGPFGYDSGRGLFHTAASTTADFSGGFGGDVPVPDSGTVSGGAPAFGGFGVDLACASCHPEGRDDGLVWQFEGLGKRRTQSVAGHILARAPYHWAGDETDLPTLMDDVFSNRMAGASLSNSQHKSLGPWLDRVPAPASPATADAAAVARGQVLFQNGTCVSCHSGDVLSNKRVYDVGTGGAFKVPSLLGVGARAPYMHDGCAATLADRFVAPCGGGAAHGATDTLTTAQIADLVAYLDTL